jgi:hypothetical protein
MFFKIYFEIKFNMRILIILSILFSSCADDKNYKWRIENPDYLDYKKPAIFLCDTFFQNGDTVYYTNTDSSKVIISIKSGKDCQFYKLK